MTSLKVTLNDNSIDFGWIVDSSLVVLVILIGLKLFSVITWSWWIVCSPLLGVLGAFSLFFTAALLCCVTNK